MTAIAALTAATMTSREIAELTDKDISHVNRDIREMLAQLTDDPELDHVREDKDLRGYTSCFHLTKNLTMTIVAGYSVKLRKKIIDRWQELESTGAVAIPKTMAQALRLAADQAEQIEAQQILIEQQKPAVEFVDRFVEAKSAKGFREVAKILGLKEREFIADLAHAKIIFKQANSWLPFADYTPRFFTVKTGEANNHAFIQTRFTPEGIAWIAKRYSKAA